MRMDHGMQARRNPTHFGIPRPELLDEELFLEEDLLAGEKHHKKKKSLFGFLATEKRQYPSNNIDPTSLSRANKYGGG